MTTGFLTTFTRLVKPEAPQSQEREVIIVARDLVHAAETAQGMTHAHTPERITIREIAQPIVLAAE